MNIKWYLTSICITGFSFLYSCLDPLSPDAEDCTDSSLGISIYSVASAECGAPAGSVSVIATGGHGLKWYRLDENPPQRSGDFTSLKAGKYTVSVFDSLNCMASVQVHVPSGISFKETVKPIIETSCIKSGCHDGSGSLDFRDFENLTRYPSDLKALVQARLMPREGSLTNDEIEKIACWVDDGALFN